MNCALEKGGWKQAEGSTDIREGTIFEAVVLVSEMDVETFRESNSVDFLR